MAMRLCIFISSVGWRGGLLVLLACLLVMGGCDSPNTATFRIEQDAKDLKERSLELQAKREAAQEPFADWQENSNATPPTAEQERKLQEDFKIAQRVLLLTSRVKGYAVTHTFDGSVEIRKENTRDEPAYSVHASAELQGRQVLVHTWIDYSDDFAQALAKREQLALIRYLAKQLGSRFPQRVVFTTPQ